MYELALGRDASGEELADALEFVDLGEPATTMEMSLQLARPFAWGMLDRVIGDVQFHRLVVGPLSRWEQLAQVLLMSNEFMYVD
jgi:hypothetical protein